MEEKKLGAIILAAGKGKRMESSLVNKVALLIANKPMILHTVELLELLNISQIIVVVGFAKESVKKALESKDVVFADQKDQLGTAHAVLSGLQKVLSGVSHILVLQGDDSVLYKPETLQKLIDAHLFSHASLTFLTIEVDNPYGLGRVVRDENDHVRDIIEEKDADNKIKKIHEINPACYVFKTTFLKKYLPFIETSPVTGEYYLTGLIDLAITYGEKIETLKAGRMPWRGVNTKEELLEAVKTFSLGRF